MPVTDISASCDSTVVEKPPGETEHPVGCLVMCGVTHGDRHANVCRLKEMHWWLLEDVMKLLQVCKQVTEHTPGLQIDILS